MKTASQLLKEFSEDVKDLAEPKKKSKERRVLSIWIPPEYKERYDRIQIETSGEFCDALRDLVKKAIDSVDPKQNSG